MLWQEAPWFLDVENPPSFCGMQKSSHWTGLVLLPLPAAPLAQSGFQVYLKDSGVPSSRSGVEDWLYFIYLFLLFFEKPSSGI